MNMLPSQFHAQTASDFIGPARLNALYIEQLVAQSQPIGAPIKLLILGPPGVGKSDLAGFLARLLHIDKWSLQKFNGTQLKIETVDDLVNEVDALVAENQVPHALQMAVDTYLR